MITPSMQEPVTAIFDSGASNHYLQQKDIRIAQDIKKGLAPTVTIPNLTTTTSPEHTHLPLSPELSKNAQKAHIIPNLQSSTLLSIRELCHDKCDVIFRKEKVYVLRDIPFSQEKNIDNGLWDMNIYPAQKTLLQSSNF